MFDKEQCLCGTTNYSRLFKGPLAFKASKFSPSDMPIMWRSAFKHVPRAPHPLPPARTSSKSSLISNHTRDFHVTRPNALKRFPAAERLLNKVKDSILLLEAKQGPLGRVAVGLGQTAAVAGLTFGTGAAAFYLFSDKKKEEEDLLVPTEEKELTWTFGGGNVPEYAQARLHSSYMYLANSVGVTALGAYASFRLFSKQLILNSVATNPVLYFGMAMGSQFLLTLLIRSLPYHEGFGVKQAGSILQGSLIGLSAAPMYLLGAQSVLRAGFISAGVFAGLSGLSTIVPHDTFLSWEKPLKIGMYGVFISFISLWFLPKTIAPAMSSIIYRIAMQGGLIVYPASFLYNSKRVVHDALTQPHFDPINSSMAMYTDVLNVYGRLAFLLPPQYYMAGNTKNVTWAAESKNNTK